MKKRRIKDTIYTVGHSTRTLEDFIKILKTYTIEILVDVRYFPYSRHNPQFNKETLETELLRNNIIYKWYKSLGGRRYGGYEKWTKTDEFKAGIKELVEIAKEKKTAVMCAEILWFKCHRRYIADILKRQKWEVFHIYDEKRLDKHKITLKRKIKCDKLKNIKEAIAGTNPSPLL